MSKPWTAVTFPKDRPVYIRQKGNLNQGASLVVSFAASGVNLCLTKGDGKAIIKGVLWSELFATCDQVLPNGNVGVCGADS